MANVSVEISTDIRDYDTLKKQLGVDLLNCIFFVDQENKGYNEAGSSSVYETITHAEDDVLPSTATGGIGVGDAIAEDFLATNRQRFLSIIESTEFVPGEDNAATEEMERLLDENKRATLDLLQEYVAKSASSEELNTTLIIKVLNLLCDYTYEQLFPQSQSIALSALALKDIWINAAALNLFAHWGNRESLNMLNNVNEPTQPWLKIKYNSIKKSLEEKCSVQG